MRMQQLALTALGLATMLGVGSAYAGDAPAGSAPAGKGKPPPGEARADKGEHGKPGHGKPEHPPDPAGKDADKDKGPDDKAKDKAHDGHGPGPHGMRELLAELKGGKLKKDELKARLSELRDRREDRAKAHRDEIKARYGATLASPAAREELEHHARRVAKLNRAMVLAETEVVKDKDKLKERIQKLIDKENARHQQAMDRFKAGSPSGAAAPSASAAAAAPPAAVAAEKGAEK